MGKWKLDAVFSCAFEHLLRTFSGVKGKTADLIDAATLRRIAVEASCDPRTVVAVLCGKTTRGLAFERAKAALERAGFRVPMLVNEEAAE